MGVTMIDSLDEANEGDTVIVRSHGEPREFYDKAAEYHQHKCNCCDNDPLPPF